MTDSEWKIIRHFSSNEAWGDVSKISLELVKRLDDLRHALDTPIFISCGTQGEHLPNSKHFLGIAGDILFPRKEVWELPELSRIAIQTFKFSCGIYPHWKYNGFKIGGMHLDVRPPPLKAWIGLADGSYLPYTERNIKEHFY